MLTPGIVAGLTVRVLDGNHRVPTLLELFAPDFVLETNLYTDFGDPKLESLVASGESSFVK